MTSLLDLGLGRSTNNNEIHLAKQLPCLRDGNEPDDVRQSSRTENSYPKLLPLDRGKYLFLILVPLLEEIRSDREISVAQERELLSLGRNDFYDEGEHMPFSRKKTSNISNRTPATNCLAIWTNTPTGLWRYCS